MNLVIILAIVALISLVLFKVVRLENKSLDGVFRIVLAIIIGGSIGYSAVWIVKNILMK